MGMVEDFNFEEASSKLAQVQDSLPESTSTLVQSTIKQLQMVQSEDPADVEAKNSIKARLHNLLQSIQDEIRTSKKLYQDDEAAAIASHEQHLTNLANLIAAYQAEISRLNTEISNTQAHLANLRADLGSERTKVENATAAIAALESLLADAKAALQQAKAQFAAETDERNRDLDDVEKARQYIIDNIHGMT